MIKLAEANRAIVAAQEMPAIADTPLASPDTEDEECARRGIEAIGS